MMVSSPRVCSANILCTRAEYGWCAVANETFERPPSGYSLICFSMTSIMLAISLDKIFVMLSLSFALKTCKLHNISSLSSYQTYLYLFDRQAKGTASILLSFLSRSQYMAHFQD